MTKQKRTMQQKKGKKMKARTMRNLQRGQVTDPGLPPVLVPLQEALAPVNEELLPLHQMASALEQALVLPAPAPGGTRAAQTTLRSDQSKD